MNTQKLTTSFIGLLVVFLLFIAGQSQAQITYCASNATSTADEDIWNVTLGTLNNTSNCSSVAPGPGSLAAQYGNYTSLPAPVLIAGNTYSMSVTLAYCGATAYSNTAGAYIDFNQNGLLTDAGEQVWLKPSGSYALPSQVFTFNITVPATALTGNTRLRVVNVEASTVSPCGTYTWGETEDYTVTIIPAFNCSGSPTPGNTTSNLSGSACNGQSYNFSISGLASLGGGISYQWQSSSDNITYTNISGANGPNYSTTISSNTWLRCETSCSFSGLSASSVPFFAQAGLPPLSGIYTINSLVATGGTNYSNFNSAISDLACRGISGPVTFNVNASSGPYTEQVTMVQVVGASSTNTITFNGNGRTLQFNSSNSAAPWTLGLDGTDFTQWNNLVINGQGITSALTVHLWNQADNNNFTNCTFNCNANGTSATQVPFSISSSATSATASTGPAGNNNILTNCTIFSGYYGISIVGNSTANATGNQLVGCTVNDSYLYAVYTLYNTGLVISNNLIQRPTRTTLTTFYGIFGSTGTINCLIERNRIRNPFAGLLTSTSVGYGIYVSSAGGLGTENRIYNNLISDFNYNGSAYGIYTLGAYTRIYHNTIAFNQTTSTATGVTYGIYSSGTLAVDIRNNSVDITRGGTGSKFCLYFSGTGKTSNNNNLRMGAAAGTVNCVGFYVSNFVTLANWQTANASAWDALSKSADPLYLSPATGNYTPTNPLLNNAGAAVGVTTDITGAARNASTPDIGAYEFNVAGLEAGISWVSPTSPASVGLKTITVNIANQGGTAINSLDLRYTDGVTVVNESFTGLNIAPSSSQNISFTTQYNLTAGTTITASILLVNGVTDGNAGNNVVNYSLCIGLAGTYTINSGLPTGSGNFQTFNAAVSALNCGIVGPVVFNVAANSGPYNEQVVMLSVANTSATNTITFNGNGNTLQFNSSNSLLPSTFELQGTDWVRVNNMVFSAQGTTYAYPVHLWNQADNNIFTNCTFNCPANGTSSLHVPFS
ncbi:MAG: GEVED domain-containing protein, partial [Bacteroidota bacterium]